MPNNELNDLMATVEAARAHLHPSIDADFVRAVVLAEEQNPEDDAAATEAIEKALRNYLDAKETP